MVNLPSACDMSPDAILPEPSACEYAPDATVEAPSAWDESPYATVYCPSAWDKSPFAHVFNGGTGYLYVYIGGSWRRTALTVAP